MSLLMLVAGLVILTLGAEALVRGASRLATSVGLSPLVVGLTVVAFGTSAPELAVSVKAALAGQTDIAIGNAVGSNIFNVLAILGLAATVAPLVASSQLVRLDVPVMIAASAWLWWCASDGTISRGEGVLLFLGIVLYTGYLIREGLRAPDHGGDLPAANEPPPRLAWSIAAVAVGLGMLVGGASLFVDGATAMARALGASELVIALTIVAAGTSMPELATSLVASFRGQRDIAIGNIVGSNIFNIFAVVGVTATVSPQGLAAPPAALAFDIPVAMAVAAVCLPIFFTGGRIARWEGVVMVGYYVAYVTCLVLAATGHPQLGTLQSALLWFVLPLTLLGIAVSVYYERQKIVSQRRQDAAGRGEH